MNQSYVAAVRRASVVLCGVLLASCEATTFPAETAPVETLGIEGAELQATSSYIDLLMRLGDASAQGNTCGAANQVSSTCGNSGGAPDYNFKWVAPRSGNFTFTTVGSTFDAVLQLSQWGNGVSVGCNDNHAGTAQSTFSVYVPAGATLRITVDGANGGCGEFQLNIAQLVDYCGTSFCNAPPSACNESFGTCSAGICNYAPRPAGAACNDGNACTTGDICNSSGTCVGNAITCNSPPGECYQATGTCSNGGCGYAPKPSGSSCSDGNSCTTGDYCNGSGSCISGTNSCCGTGYTACNGECCRNSFEYCDGWSCMPLNNCATSGGGDNMLPACGTSSPEQ